MLSRISTFSGPLSPLFKINEIIGFITDGLILRYEISDTNSYSGTSSVIDLAGNSNGTLYNGPTYSINGYLNLDGVNDYVLTDTSLNSKLSPSTSSTVISYFTWIYPQDNGVIVSEQGTYSLNSGWHYSPIEMVSGNLKFGLWIEPSGVGSISNLTSSIPTPINNWHYVGLTYDGEIMKTYVNGQSAGTKLIARVTPATYSQGLYYGIGVTDGTNMGDDTYAKMKFGAFHVYNKALSNQEVVSNYNYTKSNYIYTGSMSIWIDANDPESYLTGSSISDLSGNGYTHSLSSGVIYSTNGFKYFDCSTASNNYIRVNGTGPTLPTTGYTYVSWARVISDSTGWRTLYRSAPNDHALLVEIGTDRLGFYDNNTNLFYYSGYDVTSIKEKWVQYSIVGDSSSTLFYINDIQVGSVYFGAGGNRHDYFGGLDGQSFGYVGNMMLYSKKLTQEQIKQNYDALKHVYSFQPTQLLLNSSFDGGTTNWTATGGFAAYSYNSSSQVAVLNGVLYFTYVSRTVSQSVTVSDIISDVNTFTGVLNIKRIENGPNNNDTYSFVLLFKNSSGTTIATKTTGTVIAPQNYTDISLTLNRSEISGTFNDISSIQVNITGVDAGFWNGNHGPMVDYVTLTAS